MKRHPDFYDYRNSPAYQYLSGLMKQYQLDSKPDWADKFADDWGHDHDFGSFQMKGKMEDRHLMLLAAAMTKLYFYPSDIEGKDVVDIGCWSGGVSLLAHAMGAKRVSPVDENFEHWEMAMDLSTSLGIGREYLPIFETVYNLRRELHIDLDFVFMLGVPYHLTDIIRGLQVTNSILKKGGRMLVETAIIDRDDMMCQYKGTSLTPSTWIVPSTTAFEQMLKDTGFEIMSYAMFGEKRAMAYVEKV